MLTRLKAARTRRRPCRFQPPIVGTTRTRRRGPRSTAPQGHRRTPPGPRSAGAPRRGGGGLHRRGPRLPFSWQPRYTRPGGARPSPPACGVSERVLHSLTARVAYVTLVAHADCCCVGRAFVERARYGFAPSITRKAPSRAPPFLRNAQLHLQTTPAASTHSVVARKPHLPSPPGRN